MNEENKDQKIQELENQLKRALADYDNLKKRFEKEKSDVIKFSNEILLIQLLGIFDGLELTARGLQSLLKQSGFEKQEVKVGDTFDSQTMEATETEGEGTQVIEVYAPAYKLHEKLVRPAKVKVGKINKGE